MFKSKLLNDLVETINEGIEELNEMKQLPVAEQIEEPKYVPETSVSGKKHIPELEEKCKILIDQLTEFFEQNIDQPDELHVDLWNRELYIFKTIQNDNSLDIGTKYKFYNCTLENLKMTY